jgi:hypothetical protein
MVMAEEVGEEKSIYDPELLKPEVFHKIKLGESARMTRGVKQRLYDEVEKRFVEMMIGKCENRKWIKSFCWKVGCDLYADQMELGELVLKECKNHKGWISGKGKSGIRVCAVKKVVGDCLLEKIKEDYSNLLEVVGSFISCIQSDLLAAFHLPTRPGRHKTVIEKERERFEETGDRVRLCWTRAETNKLLRLRKKGVSWAKIANQLPERTGMDCRDKFRNIEKGEKVIKKKVGKKKGK